MTSEKLVLKAFKFKPPERIETETKRLIDLGRNGGFVLGTHSIGPEIPLHYTDNCCRDVRGADGR